MSQYTVSFSDWSIEDYIVKARTTKQYTLPSGISKDDTKSLYFHQREALTYIVLIPPPKIMLITKLTITTKIRIVLLLIMWRNICSVSVFK